MKSSQTLSRRQRAVGANSRSRKSALRTGAHNEEAGLPEGPVWGHWFNTEAMVINNHGAPAHSRELSGR
jgi:hypothetical protein